MLLAKTLKSSTLRLALISIAAFGSVVLGLLFFVHHSTVSFVIGRSDRTIRIDLSALREAYRDRGRVGLGAALARRIAESTSEGGIYLFVDPSFAPIVGNVPTWPSIGMGIDGWITFRAPEWRPDVPERAVVRGAVETLPDGGRLLVGRVIDDLDHFASNMDAALASSLVFIFILAGVASIFVTRRTVGRIESINATCRVIMTSGLGSRIPLQGTRDEWDQLSANLNAMLDRIEALMAEVKQVTDNVAHDLRTPLTHIRSRLEKALDRPRDGERDQAVIMDMLTDLDNVLRMFTSVTRISQIEASDRTAAFRVVNIAEIAKEVVELLDAAAEEAGAKLTVVGEPLAYLNGDRDLLFDALTNLVENAIKHGRDRGTVTVDIVKSVDAIDVSVTDDGLGIPADEIEHVTKRFYRLERSRSTPGNGLGLSLVAAVARLHGARIAMEDNAPGLRLRLSFPLRGGATLC